MFELDDSSESEVALDFVGSFFNHLIDTDYYQDDTGASQAVEEEVIIISSGSTPLLRQKIRRVTRKVSFSHHLAHLDPHFLLKQQQHENRRQTRNNGGEELSSGLPNTQARRKRQNEVLPNLNSFYPLAGLIRQPLNSSDSNLFYHCRNVLWTGIPSLIGLSRNGGFSSADRESLWWTKLGHPCRV